MQMDLRAVCERLTSRSERLPRQVQASLECCIRSCRSQALSRASKARVMLRRVQQLSESSFPLTEVATGNCTITLSPPCPALMLLLLRSICCVLTIEAIRNLVSRRT